VLFRLLAVATWSSRPCRADMPLSRAIAGIFESPEYELKNHHVRPLANAWANWGASGVLDIFTAWNSAAAPHVAAAAAAAMPVRSARRAAVLARAAPRRQVRGRLPRPIGSRLPAGLADFVVDLTV
jgi:hypothetical protein